ncbi:Cyclic di-GMP phosphodiesterase Gmr [compost metagenome]
MAFGMFFGIVRQRNFLRVMVDTRTQELRTSNEELSSINEELMSGEEELRKQYVLLDQYTYELQESKQQLTYLAYNDVLTGISNRTAFQGQLEQLFNLTDHPDLETSIIFFDLDNFKIVNDTYGHHIGDQLLKDVVNRIVNAQLPIHMFARLGGDEFAILITDLEQQQVSELAEAILNLFRNPFFIVDHMFFAAPSLGIVQYPAGGTTSEELLKNADIAMYKAKKDGGNQYKWYHPSMLSDSLEKLEMGNHLRQALERNELEIHYQPQVDCRLGKVIGIEALLRWNHTTKGYISPAVFIPIAEELNLIVPIGDWVMLKACEQIKIFQNQHQHPLRLSVNLSVKQLQDQQIVEKVRDVLKQTGLNASYLELEITENVAMKDDQFEVLTELRNLGVAISVDDFGTHYSSLSYLKRFPVTKIKLDQSFVRGIQSDFKDRALIQAIIFVAKSLDMEIIAEGVEVEEQARFLVENGCSLIQGYYFYRPMELVKIKDTLNEDLKGKLFFLHSQNE